MGSGSSIRPYIRVPAAISSYVCFLPLSLRDILTLGVVYWRSLAAAGTTVVLLALARVLTRVLTRVLAALARVLARVLAVLARVLAALAVLTRVLALRSAELDQAGRSIGR